MTKKHRRILRFVTVFVALSTLVAVISEMYCKRKLHHSFRLIGRSHFLNYDAFSADFESNNPIEKGKLTLLWTPPYGWIALKKIERIEDGILYASKNFGFPEGGRFRDQKEAAYFGFDYREQSEGEIVEAIEKLFR